MIKNIKYILTGAFFYTCQIYAQTLGVVKGVVKDKANNESLPGAVVVLDKAKGVAADIEGVFYMTTAIKENLTICNRNYVGWNIRRNVTRLCFNNW